MPPYSYRTALGGRREYGGHTPSWQGRAVRGGSPRDGHRSRLAALALANRPGLGVPATPSRIQKPGEGSERVSCQTAQDEREGDEDEDGEERKQGVGEAGTVGTVGTVGTDGRHGEVLSCQGGLARANAGRCGIRWRGWGGWGCGARWRGGVCRSSVGQGGQGGVLLEDDGAVLRGGNRCEARQRCVWRGGAAGQVER